MDQTTIFAFAAVLCAALLSFTLTPPVRVLAYKIGAIDVPRDDRRMHTKPIPRIGGVAIFLAFTITSIVFCEYSKTMLAIWFGGLLLAVMGVLDDVYQLNSWIKLSVQIIAALAAVSQGVVVTFINFFGNYITLGPLGVPVTILWIVGLTNGINLIDGLDGLACGVSAISSISLFCVTFIMGDMPMTILTAIIAGSCMGFLPFNSNPAKIFMGDSGALFLGYTFSILSVQGVFKTNTVLSFLIPMSIFGLPLFDSLFAILRRLKNGKHPFKADRGHLHHRLIDMGFGQKKSVRILYAICGIFGIAAVMLSSEYYRQALVILSVSLVILMLNYIVVKNKKTRVQTGLFDEDCGDFGDCGADSKPGDCADETAGQSDTEANDDKRDAC